MAEPLPVRAFRMTPGIAAAALAAVLFGATTPAAHWLLGFLPPLLLSALLYLGSGLGLSLHWLLSGARRAPPQPVTVHARLSLAAAIACGGVAAPVALLYGLQHTAASSAALLLNLEGVLTAVVAWTVFDEGVDTGVALGMGCVVVAAVLLGWPAAGPGAAFTLAALRGPLLIALACLCWALDNNFTRAAAELEASRIARWKGLAAGLVNLLLATAIAGGPASVLHTLQVPWTVLLLALATGWLGYGLSLVAYVRAQALLGAARTGAWFGLAPFAGVAAALLVLREPAPPLLWPATGLMACGLWLHVRERHAHWHQHAPQVHTHRHVHDAHHQHAHDPDWQGEEPHTHAHAHPALLHRHVHFPDLHHRHRHTGALAAVAPAQSRLPTALIDAYTTGTTYRVLGLASPGQHHNLRIGLPDPALRTRLHGLRGALLITAFNPLGEPLAPAANAQRQQALQAALDAAGLTWLPAIGQGDDGQWPAEASALVLDVDRNDALLLGTAWQQNAVVWSGPDGVPTLLLLR